MSRLRIEVGATELVVDNHVSSTATGSHHYLRSPRDGVNWRVRGEVVHYELAGRRPVRDCAKVCRCQACKRLKPRRGGRNTNHVFVCLDCVREEHR